MYIVTYILDIAALFYLMGLLYTGTALNNSRKKPFLIGTILTIVIILSEIGTVFAEGNLKLRSLNVLCNVLGFSLTPMVPIAIASIFDRRLLKSYKLLLAPTVLDVLAAVLSPLYGYIFYVDANNRYLRGDYFFLFVTVYILNFFLLMRSTLKSAGENNYPIKGKLLALAFFILIGTTIQLVEPLAYSS